MFPAKKGIELCILNSSLAFCLYSVLYWIPHYVDDFATNRTKRSTLNIKRWQLLPGGGSKQRPILNTTTAHHIRVSKKEEGGYILQLYSGGILVLQLLGDNFG